MSTRRPLARKTASQANIPVQSAVPSGITGVENASASRQKAGSKAATTVAVHQPTAAVLSAPAPAPASTTAPLQLSTTDTAPALNTTTVHPKVLAPSSAALLVSPARPRSGGIGQLLTISVDKVLADKSYAGAFIDTSRQRLKEYMKLNQRYAVRSSQDAHMLRAVQRDNKALQERVKHLHNTLNRLQAEQQSTALQPVATHNTAADMANDQQVETLQEKLRLAELQRVEVVRELELIRTEQADTTARLQAEVQQVNRAFAQLQDEHQAVQNELAGISAAVKHHQYFTSTRDEHQSASARQCVLLILYDVHQLAVRCNELQQQLSAVTTARHAESAELIERLRSELLDERRDAEARELNHAALLQAYHSTNQQADILAQEVERLQAELVRYRDIITSISDRIRTVDSMDIVQHHLAALESLHTQAVPPWQESYADTEMQSALHDNDEALLVVEQPDSTTAGNISASQHSQSLVVTPVVQDNAPHSGTDVVSADRAVERVVACEYDSSENVTHSE